MKRRIQKNIPAWNDFRAGRILVDGFFKSEVAFFYRINNGFGDAFFIDGTNGRSGYFKGYPFSGFGQVKLLFLKVGLKSAFCLLIGEGNIVANHGFLAGDIANT